MGHAAGDELLVSVAERLLLGLRSSDTARAWAATSLPYWSKMRPKQEILWQVAERIMEFLRTPFRIAGRKW